MSLLSTIEQASKRALSYLVLAAVVISLAGCTGGFRPMYASSDFGGTGPLLAKVDIGTIPGRTGQKIRNELLFQRGSDADKVEKTYRLEVALRQRTTSSLVVSSGDSLSKAVTVTASFRLVSTKDNSEVLVGQSTGRAAFERFDSSYANVRAERDAADRAATTVARDLRSRLEAFLASKV
ncbi:MAG: LPS assembly lipoprotein LptE [Pseudomonadota bacterium]